MKRRMLCLAAAALAAAMVARAQRRPLPARPAPSLKDVRRDLRGAGTTTPKTPETQTSQPATTSAPSGPAATRPAAAERRGLLASLAHAAAKLYLYFGVVGVASVIAWLAVWGVLTAWALRTRGMAVCLGVSLLVGLGVVWLYTLPETGGLVGMLLWLAILAALGVVGLWSLVQREIPVAFAGLILALVAFGLGMWNSDNVSVIREDRTAELQAARERQMAARRAELRKLKSKAADIHFAEDDANDALDLAGYKRKDANAVATSTTRPAYAYRQTGKKKRDANMVADANEDILTKVVADRARQDDAADRVRLLPGRDVIVANQLDMLNRFAVRLTLVVALILAAVEYLRRFNLTFGSILPMPIACRAIDSLWPKTHAVHLHTADEGAVRDYLQTVVQKGESFLYFAPADPWPGGKPSLARLPVRGLWPLRKITCEPGDPTYGTALVFESAWYGRYCFVLRAEDVSEALAAFLSELLGLLRMRRHTRATAARTVHLVWNVPSPMPHETLEELAFLCRETNLKLVVASPDPPTADAAELFDELCTA